MSGESTPDNVLFETYERYIGDPETETDVYAGFGLFFAGVALGAVGIVVFLLSNTATGLTVYAYREVASVAAAAGLPVLLLGIVVLLPVDRRMLYAALLGSAVCAAAIALFSWSYPYHWNVPDAADYSAQGVAVYAVGLVAVMGATAAALVGHQVQRAGGGAVAAGEGAASASAGDEAADEDAESVTERAERDYEEAVSGAEVSWGGVEKTETTRLNLEPGAGGDDIDRSSFDTVEAAERRGAGVDDAVSGLKGLKGKGGKADTGTGSGTDEQTSALRELREQQRREQEAEPDGVVDRVRQLFS
jgi:hypothetical protein